MMLSKSNSVNKLFLKYLQTKANNKCCFTSTNTDSLKKTSLNQLHKDLGGKMVEFCGWEMPVMYKTGVLKEHLHCRTNSSLFDVSHMAQLKIHGKDRIKFFESLVVADLEALPKGSSKLSVFTNDKGGIIDDTMITNQGDCLYVVVNAGCAEKDIAHIQSKLKQFKEKSGASDVHMEILGEQSLIAIQGPKTEEILQKLLGKSSSVDLGKMEFMTQLPMNISGIPCIVTRCGYTGEDGFEISVHSNQAQKLAEILLSCTTPKEQGILPAGLGARDSLRLEAGLCLYGHDLNEDITPIEGTLAWLIGKRRREQGGFPGANIILPQIKDGVSKKRVGVLIQGPPAREGTQIIDPITKQPIGNVTSGTLSPMTKDSISMAYVPTSLSKVGTPLTLLIRDKEVQGTVTKMPFVATNYKKI
ncbi:aminomethyltransferase [Tieghemostelium lacteum]|uniref:Aminomethyltransferase n=1 Tax=Tieghemostelium lacteum TaxID=361077 RepID=A0A152A7V8_TIELA|nr:aminomethyltransferase [Tieghemostelium lacteum]|eukprot:KYR02298.1 aminomethyltransferase [Tieghemostelium lacteum]